MAPKCAQPCVRRFGYDISKVDPWGIGLLADWWLRIKWVDPIKRHLRNHRRQQKQNHVNIARINESSLTHYLKSWINKISGPQALPTSKALMICDTHRQRIKFNSDIAAWQRSSLSDRHSPNKTLHLCPNVFLVFCTCTLEPYCTTSSLLLEYSEYA